MGEAAAAGGSRAAAGDDDGDQINGDGTADTDGDTDAADTSLLRRVDEYPRAGGPRRKELRPEGGPLGSEEGLLLFGSCR